MVSTGYSFSGAHFALGAAVLDGEVQTGSIVHLPLRTMNRHGLIAGATGTGKTKTLQLLAEGLSASSVPVLMMDIKGDMSGLAAAGQPGSRIDERLELIGTGGWKPAACPVELLTLSEAPGVRLRSTVIEFGPILMSRILGLNETQEGVMSMVFKYCDDERMALLDLKDLVRVLQHVGGDGRKELEAIYGRLSPSTTGTILRKVVELQQQGGDEFFGEPSFDVEDLMRIAPDGRGIVSILRVTEMQDRPKLFSTFMLGLLAELYANLPEEGDLDTPKLLMFIDEAHLIFQEATPALLQQLETVIKLIRSKGVGIFFCTQNPQDIPAPILSQLGLKIQHALRAFTAADRKGIKLAAENYPETEFYQVDELLTGLGIGEALVTLLNEKGIPTPLVHTMLMPPSSRMGVLSDTEISGLVSQSKLVSKYAHSRDSESAYEILSARMEAAEKQLQSADDADDRAPRGREPREKSIFDDPIVRQAGKTAATILTRSLLGALGLGGGRRKGRGLF
jgi:DNA helicase HerA-like ATPase